MAVDRFWLQNPLGLDRASCAPILFPGVSVCRSGVFATACALSSPTASRATMRSPLNSWVCSRSAALSSVTSSARITRPVDLDVEHLLVANRIEVLMRGPEAP